MATKQPKTRCNESMTESAWLAWIRSALRSKSLKWKPRGDTLEAARRPYKGANKLQKWEYQCAICKKWYKAKEVIVDHFPKAAGSILKFEDIGEFCNNLFCDSTNLRVLDKQCHDCHTLAEKNGITFEEAKLEKEIIEFCKKPTKEIVAFLISNGYTTSQMSNATKRRQCVETIFRRNNE